MRACSARSFLPTTPSIQLTRAPPPKRATRAHKLSGEWKGLWECHIEPDWLLIYDITSAEVLLIRTGAHSDLFDQSSLPGSGLGKFEICSGLWQLHGRIDR